MPSILISSAGRRISLLRLFQNAARIRGWKVIAGDCDALAPALYLAGDAVILPRVDSLEYIARLLELVQAHEIRLLVPTIDTELLALAQSAPRFLEAGCRALISTPEFVAIARDKWRTAMEFSRRGVEVPKSWLPADVGSQVLPEQLFVKPRDGSSSIHAYRTRRDGLDRVLKMVPNPIIQEELRGMEITIDALLDFSGAPLHFVPRERLRTLGGESIQGKTIECDRIKDWVIRGLNVAGQMGACGPLTLQGFLTEAGPVLTEVNPRFGGGFPLSYAAGAHYPEWVVDMVDGREAKPRIGEFTPNLYMSRYYEELFFSAPVGDCTK